MWMELSGANRSAKREHMASYYEAMVDMGEDQLGIHSIRLSWVRFRAGLACIGTLFGCMGKLYLHSVG